MIAIISIIVCVNFVFRAVCFTDEFFVFILTFINKAILQEMQNITTAPSPAVKKKRIKSLGNRAVDAAQVNEMRVIKMMVTKSDLFVTILL